MYFHWSISRRVREIQNVSNRFSQFGKSRHVDGRQESFLVAWALVGILLENIQWNNWGLACVCLFGAFCKFSYFVKLLFILALLIIFFCLNWYEYAIHSSVKLGDLIILKMCVIVLMLGWYLIIDMVLICFGCKKWEERRGMERRGGERKWERKRVNLNLFSLTWNYPFFPYVFPLSSFPLLSFPFVGKGSWCNLRNVIVTMCLAIFDYVRSEDMILWWLREVKTW